MDDLKSDSDNDSQMRYIRQEFFQPNNDREGEDGDDDSSIRFFVSEPSTSEADSSENLMRLGSIGGMLGMDGNLLYSGASASEEDNLLLHLYERENNIDSAGDEECIEFITSSKAKGVLSTAKASSKIIEIGTESTPPLAPNTANNSFSNTSKNHSSPARPVRSCPPAAVGPTDNLSLSSLETASSTRWNKVELDFSPVRSHKTGVVSREVQGKSTEGGSGDRFTSSPNINQDLHHPYHHSLNNEEDVNEEKSNNVKNAVLASIQQPEDNRDISSDSSSSASETQVQQLGDFLNDLRISSEGKMKESSVPGSNTSFESSVLLTKGSDVKDVLRRNNTALALPGRRFPSQHQQPAPQSPKENSPRVLMDYSKDSSVYSQGASGGLPTTLSIGSEEYRRRQEVQHLDPPVVDTIDMMASSSTLPISLPPLYTTVSTGNTGGRKQQHDRQRRWSADVETKSSNEDKKILSKIERQDSLSNYSENATSYVDTHARFGRNSYKSTISRSGDERSNQQTEIRLFSQLAVDNRDNDIPRRSRRIKQRSYRQMRKRHRHQETGEDSSSQVSLEQSLDNFFQPPLQFPIDASYQSTSPSSTPRMTTHSKGCTSPPLFQGAHNIPFSIHSPRDKSIKNSGSLKLNQPSIAISTSAPDFIRSFDGTHSSKRLSNQQPPPLHIDVNGSVNAPWENTNYRSSPTYYVPAQSDHRSNDEVPVLNQRFQVDQHPHYQYPYGRNQSLGVPFHGRSFEGGNHLVHGQQHFVATTPHAGTSTSANQFFSDGKNRNHSLSHDSSRRSSVSGHELQESHFEQERRDSYVFDDNTSYSVSEHSSDDSIERERNIHLLHDQLSHRSREIRHHHNDSIPKFDRRQFLPQTSSIQDSADESKYPTYVCPNCNMRQRQFFTVSSAPKHYESEGTMISLFFAAYIVAALYIFGLQEGWGRLDCIYFAVITLTTAGLGDLVPTTDGAKIMCSIFIYFGVACIGLLLGSYIAGMLDEKSYREAMTNQIMACPNCARIRTNMRYISERRSAIANANKNLGMQHIAEMHATRLRTKNSMARTSEQVHRSDNSQHFQFQSEVLSKTQSMERGMEEPSTNQNGLYESPTTQKQQLVLGSPTTKQILYRQSHTRHVSMDLRSHDAGSIGGNGRKSSRTDFDRNAGRYRNNSADLHIPATVNEGKQSIYERKHITTEKDVPSEDDKDDNESLESLPVPPLSGKPQHAPQNEIDDDSTIDDSDSEFDSLASQVDELEGRNRGVKTAKYVIFTFREAIVNSLVIIAFGCLGFYLIEGFSLVDSLYFTTVLLTSTGYGDIVPKTEGGKLFATVYLLVGGTILLNNMSMISMIPLELRKRRTEHSVLTQFGDSLDDDALRELATGPLIQRINLGGKNPRGLDECTREMFALAMMIRLGKVTEHDIKLTFAAFRKLDVNNEGILNSKSIIGGIIQKRRRISRMNLNNRNNNDYHGRNSGFSQVYGSWINPPVTSHYDGNHNRRRSSKSSFFPTSHGHAMNHSDQAPLLSMSDRGFFQYGMNEYSYAPTINE